VTGEVETVQVGRPEVLQVAATDELFPHCFLRIERCQGELVHDVFEHIRNVECAEAGCPERFDIDPSKGFHGFGNKFIIAHSTRGVAASRFDLHG